MATYTGTADENGDFTVIFGGAEYTSGQKVTVTALKDGAEKSIEIFAPSDTTNGGVIQFLGNLNNFPENIGDIRLDKISGIIGASAFEAGSPTTSLFKKATGLVINHGVVDIGSSAFRNWVLARHLTIPETVTTIQLYAFQGWTSCDEITILATTPPALNSSSFQGLKATCIFKVPLASLEVYKVAANWSTFASRMVGV